MARPFLTAQWSDLCILSYAVPRELLTPHLPSGLTLDELDGRCFVSLVAFDFLDTRVRGVRVPTLTDFPEVNLRFYVRDGDRRGVCFIRELVPKRVISLVARLVYNEPYRTARMTSCVEREDERVEVEHRIKAGGVEHCLRVVGRSTGLTPGAESVEHFFKEHQWGYGRDRRGRTLVYEVRHPVWEIDSVESAEIDIDFAALYGSEWEFLSDAEPDSTVLARGSAVEVYPKGRFE